MREKFKTGMEVLLEERAQWVHRARIGLVAHAASVNASGAHSAMLLHEHERCHLACLFGPEHGFAGLGAAGQQIKDGIHPALGLPVRSLYGVAKKPTAAMMDSLDVLVFDLQDIGVRCYTYVSTLRGLLEAAAKHGKRVVVTDRPIPFPNTIDGPLLDPSCRSFVGCVPTPLVYGMTSGETALFLRDTLGLDVDLKVAPMRGYHRDARAAPGAPAWIPPSPALKSRGSAWCYPATVFSEAIPVLDCDRAGPRPFQVLSAPFIESGELLEALSGVDLPGVNFEPHPSDAEHGIRMRVTRPDEFLPVTTGITLLSLLRDLYGDKALWQQRGVREGFFDLLCGTPQVREELQAGERAAWITAGWVQPRKDFKRQRARHLLYEAKQVQPAPPHRITRVVSPPRKAVVLAAGFGTRIRPLSLDLPKPLMPLWGLPLVEHTLRLLASWGVHDVVLNMHHQASELLAFASRRTAKDLRINLSFEADILGTGGALDRARWFLDDEPFWMINADIAADLDPVVLQKNLGRGRKIAALWLDARRGPLTVEMDHGLIRSFRSRRPGQKGCYTFCGLQLLSPRILDYVARNKFSTIVDAYEQAGRDGWDVGGVAPEEAYWRDLGSREQYLAAHSETRAAYRAGLPGARFYDPAGEECMRELRKSGVRVSGFVFLGKGATVAPGAVVQDSVIWPGAQVAGSARMKQAVVGRETRVTGPAQGALLRADQALGEEEAQTLEGLGFNANRATFQLVADRRGSARSFARIVQGRRRVMLVRYDVGREENALYAGHARFLHRLGVPVPQVRADRPQHGFTVFDDLGDRSLQQAVRRCSDAKRLTLYRDVLDAVVRMHERGAGAVRRLKRPLMPPFSPDLYRWEADLFAEHFLRPVLELDAPSVRALLGELKAVAGDLAQQPTVLLHRDFQSSNILLHRGRPMFIDFQGMRLGPAVYDLASLLVDPYVGLDEASQRNLFEYYATLHGWGGNMERLFWLAAVERLCQALGAFGRLSRLPGGASFRRHIPPALHLLHRAATKASDCGKLAKLVDL